MSDLCNLGKTRLGKCFRIKTPEFRPNGQIEFPVSHLCRLGLERCLISTFSLMFHLIPMLYMGPINHEYSRKMALWGTLYPLYR